MLEILDRQAIVGGAVARSRSLTGILLLPNGDLLIGYREGTDHLLTDDGVVMTIRSTDGGRSWQRPSKVVEISDWDCAGGRSMTTTPDGDLLMYVFLARRSIGANPEAHVFPIRSTDGGRSWGSMGEELALFDGWTEPNTSGEIIELSGGQWMIPVYGSATSTGVINPSSAAQDGSKSYSIVAFSQDDGKTWPSTCIVAQHPSINFHELAVTRVKEGRFLAVIRTQDPPYTSYQSDSDDEGRTWSTPKPLPFCGQTPSLIQLPSGVILCAYRDRAPDKLGVSVSLTYDEGISWEFGGQLYAGTDWNCGYPGLVYLPGGDVFCVYYSCYDARGNSEIHGLRLREGK